MEKPNPEKKGKSPNPMLVKKQMKALKKEAQRMSKEFGVDACFIHVDDYSSSSSPQIVLWPENQDIVCSMIERFKSLPEEERKKCIIGPADFLQEKINNLRSEKEKLEKDKILRMMNANPNLDGLRATELKDKIRRIDSKLMDIEQVRALNMKGSVKEGEKEMP
ncbi:uncharacterized protein LOC143891985 [Tasmannia lanceolata]|uniref:uncharacterized protein LOC143891985 n=1 Tax=Tasmannia lanceolata TaxID=3420 RepID=UPI004063F444